jgi:hypothetical protein
MAALEARLLAPLANMYHGNESYADKEPGGMLSLWVQDTTPSQMQQRTLSVPDVERMVSQEAVPTLTQPLSRRAPAHRCSAVPRA